MLALIAVLLFGQSANTPSGFDAVARRAAEARDAGRLDEAFSLYQQALKLRPTTKTKSPIAHRSSTA